MLVGLTLGLVGCANPDNSVRIRFPQEEYEIRLNETKVIEPTIIKSSQVDEVELAYSSSDESVVKVVDGVVNYVIGTYNPTSNPFKELKESDGLVETNITAFVYLIKVGIKIDETDGKVVVYAQMPANYYLYMEFVNNEKYRVIDGMTSLHHWHLKNTSADLQLGKNSILI